MSERTTARGGNARAKGGMLSRAPLSEGGCAARAKGFIYSLDIALSVFLFALVLIAVEFLSAQAEAPAFSEVHLSRACKDALFLLDRQGDLQSMDPYRIGFALNSTLPAGSRMRITVETYYYADGAFMLANISEFGEAVPNGTAVFGARRDFFSTRNSQVTNYSIARARIWQG